MGTGWILGLTVSMFGSGAARSISGITVDITLLYSIYPA
jgi:hypothetical protein